MKLVLVAGTGAALAAMAFRDEAGTTGDAGAAAAPATPAKTRESVMVDMKDGRKVEFVGKRKLLKETIIEGSTVSVRLDFRNGEVLVFPVPDSLLLRAAGHGIEQKLGDETAGEDDVDDMYLAVAELAQRLTEKGVEGWTTKREGGGFGGASVLVKALMEVTGKDMPTVQAFLKAKVDAGATYPKLSAAFEEDDTVGPVIKRMKKEKAGQTGVDTKALLGGLGEAAAPAPAA